MIGEEVGDLGRRRSWRRSGPRKDSGFMVEPVTSSVGGDDGDSDSKGAEAGAGEGTGTEVKSMPLG